MNSYDLCLAWNDPIDVDFVELLDTACGARRLSPLLQITPVNVEHAQEQLAGGELVFRAYMDRAVEDDGRFMPLVDWARDHAELRINPYERACHTWDKAAVHLDLFANLKTPYTIILPPFDEQPDLGDLDPSPLGPTFAAKPAHGGGGVGVVELCTRLSQVQEARLQHAADRYLLQERIVPTQLDDLDAWFRILYSAGHTYPAWWSTDTHVYSPVTVAQESHYGLEPLRELTRQIAEISGLQLFSTEIALTADREFLVVDYVNDPIDVTRQSKSVTGVPDEILGYIVADLAELVAKTLNID